MNDHVPNYSVHELQHIAESIFGITGAIKPLPSFEDQNARLTTDDGVYVLKIANTSIPVDGIAMQTETLVHMQAKAPHLVMPRVIKTLAGDIMGEYDGRTVRLYTYLDGNIFGDMPRTPKLYYNLGKFMGVFSVAVEGYNHPASVKADDYWSLDNVMACKKFLGDVVGEEHRARIGRYFNRYETTILPRVGSLRKSVIHNDANEQNVLVHPDRPDEIAGLIDFGELQWGSTVNELAVCLGYCLLGEDDIPSAARDITRGYTDQFSLTKEELDVVPMLAAMRLVISVVMSSHAMTSNPDNENLAYSQQPAKDYLKWFEENDFCFN